MSFVRRDARRYKNVVEVLWQVSIVCNVEDSLVRVVAEVGQMVVGEHLYDNFALIFLEEFEVLFVSLRLKELIALPSGACVDVAR